MGTLGDEAATATAEKLAITRLHIAGMATDSDSDSDLDLDLDLFSDEADQTAASIKAALLQRADQARGQKLAALPPPSQRTPAQNRTAYVLSRQRLQPTVLPRVLTSDECELVVAAVVDYVHRQGGLQSTRHEKFPTTDVPVSDLCLRRGSPPGTAVADLVSAWVSERVLRPLAEKTGFRPHHLGLKDLFVVCYSAPQPGPGRNSPWYPIPSQQTSLAIHSDGCLLSFTLLLNHHDAFQGGGTFFKATARTHRVQQGDVLIHDGGLEHAGAEVTAGQRIILVGFVETIDVLREKLRWEAQSARRRRPIQRHPV